MGRETRSTGTQEGAVVAAPAPSEPSPESVTAYLRRHPAFLSEFLTRHGAGVDAGDSPIRRPDGVIDLQAARVERLRGEVDGLRRQQRAIVSASRANLNSQHRVQTAVLFLLDARSFEQLIQTIGTDLAVLLDIDVACLIVEADSANGGRSQIAGVRVVGSGQVDARLGRANVALTADTVGDPALFGEGAGLVRSQALLRLAVSDSTPPALLALGSREPDGFEPGMRTDLLVFLGRVLERCIRSWLDLPG